MRIGRASGYVNCVITAPGYGRRELMITNLGYGMSIATQPDGTTRRKRVFYPFVRTSGLWFINAVFTDFESKESFTTWLVGYVARATNPHSTTLKPMTVSVPSEGFQKVGYPTSTIPMGDDRYLATYNINVGFASASDPDTLGTSASKYRRAPRDYVASRFYPAGVQSNEYIPPDPISDRVPGQDIWGDDAPTENPFGIPKPPGWADDPWGSF